MAPKILSLYKKDGVLHSRKPRKSDFNIDVVLENEHVRTSAVKTFLRNVVFSTEALTDIRYRLEVLSQQWYGPGHLTTANIPFTEGTMLYVWTYLTLPEDTKQLGVFHKLVPYDIIFIRRDITPRQLLDIRRTVDAPHLCARKMYQQHAYPVEGMHNVSITRAA